MNTTSSFDAEKYWDQRLRSSFDLRGVGFRRLGSRFNEWAYRVRRETFLTVARSAAPDVHLGRVLDVGSGTGVYIECWQQLGAGSVYGIDLTPTAVEGLHRAYPAAEFTQCDVSGTPQQLPEGPFAAISAMDVLFHIVDDDRYAAALHNLARLLADDGVLIFSEGLAHDAELRQEHIVIRRFADVERLLDDAGLEIVRRQPFLFLMNNPFDARSRVGKGLWYAIGALVSLSEWLGAFAGWLVYPVERRLVARRTESPTTEIVVCRHRTRR